MSIKFLYGGHYRITDDIDLSVKPLLEIEGVANGQMYPGKGGSSIFFLKIVKLVSIQKEHLTSH